MMHSMIVRSLCFSCLLLQLVSSSVLTAPTTINVALHAQVTPDGGSVVGSVLTTDGLKAAFDLRPETSKVELFYPYSYKGFFNTRWDLVVIEGWFMMIHEMIQLVRSHSPGVIVLFFCLDPTFPGLDGLMSFDVDGYMTNSRSLQRHLISQTGIPTVYVMLAADPSIMKPNSSIVKEWGAVYVGAGGHMLKYKPKLLNMLQGALPYKLRLHGSDWGNVEEMKSVWNGSLPRYDLANAYASAHVVLASAIESQSDIGMINNRIFEALACGAIVISDNYTELHQLAGHLLLMADNAEQVETHMQFVLNNPVWAADRSKISRAFILERHTWSHRVVEIMDFYHHLKDSQLKTQLKTTMKIDITNNNSLAVSTPKCAVGSCNRNNCPKMLWIVSEDIKHHSDVTFVVERAGFDVFCRGYVIEYVSSSDDKWQQLRDSIAVRATVSPSSSNSTDTMYEVSQEGEVIGESKSHPDVVETEGPSTSTSSCSGDCATSTSSLNWLSQYDVVLAVVKPFDDVDRTMRMLPPVDSLHRHKDRAQKRAAYLIGMDPTLIPKPPTINGRDKNDKLQQYEELSFSHYDVVWYRTAYELEQLQHAGFLINYFRMIQSFGIGGEEKNGFNVFDEAFSTSWGFSLIDKTSADAVTGVDASDVISSSTEGDRTASNLKESVRANDPDSPISRSRRDSILQHKSELKVVALCFYAHAQHCSAKVRNDMIREVNRPYTLLLVGGTLTDWLDTGVCEGFSDNMARVVLVSEGHIGPAVRMIQRAEKVFIFQEGSTDKLDTEEIIYPATTTSRPRSGPRPRHTATDIIWPLTLAAVSGTQIFLSSSHNHLQAIVFESDFPSDQWTSKGMDAVFSSGLVRLHGFGVHTARVDAVRVTVSDLGELMLYEETATLTPPAHDSTHVQSHNMSNSRGLMSPSLIVLQLAFRDYTVGRDGSCCVVYKGVTLTCLIRSVSYLIITVAAPPTSPFSSFVPFEHLSANQVSQNQIPDPGPSLKQKSMGPVDSEEIDPVEMDIQLSMRGNMFGDEIFSLSVRCLVTFSEQNYENNIRLVSSQTFKDSYRMTIEI